MGLQAPPAASAVEAPGTAARGPFAIAVDPPRASVGKISLRCELCNDAVLVHWHSDSHLFVVSCLCFAIPADPLGA